MTTGRPRFSFVSVLAAWWSIALLSSITTTTTRTTAKPFTILLPVAADSIEDEYVRQVIEEDRQHYGNDYSHDDGATHNENADQRRRAAEEQAAQEAADREASRREQKFEAELERMNDDEQKKKALRKKKTDGKVVRAVLKAHRKSDLYGVLGIRGWKFEVPPRTIAVASLKFTTPKLTLVGPFTDKQIRHHYKKQARRVHPDKNSDGRAGEAFVAVKNAADVLLNPAQRQAYDADRRQAGEAELERWKALLGKSLSTAWTVARKALGMVQTLLGPFFVPVVILLALII